MCIRDSRQADLSRGQETNPHEHSRGKADLKERLRRSDARSCNELRTDGRALCRLKLLPEPGEVNLLLVAGLDVLHRFQKLSLIHI